MIAAWWTVGKKLVSLCQTHGGPVFIPAKTHLEFLLIGSSGKGDRAYLGMVFTVSVLDEKMMIKKKRQQAPKCQFTQARL